MNLSRTKVKRINLIPRDARRSKVELSSKILPVMVLVPTLLMAISAVSQHSAYKSLKDEQQEVAKKQKELEEKIGLLTLEKNNAEARMKQVSAIQQIIGKKVRWSDIFKELSLMVSKDIWLSDLNATATDGKRAVTLEGAGQSPASISTLFQSLELSYFFRKVMLVSSKRDDKVHPPLYRYKFDVPIEEAKDALSTSASAPAGAPAPRGSR